jgi:hypothetical protein
MDLIFDVGGLEHGEHFQNNEQAIKTSAIELNSKDELIDDGEELRSFDFIF